MARREWQNRGKDPMKRLNQSLNIYTEKMVAQTRTQTGARQKSPGLYLSLLGGLPQAQRTPKNGRAKSPRDEPIIAAKASQQRRSTSSKSPKQRRRSKSIKVSPRSSPKPKVIREDRTSEKPSWEPPQVIGQSLGNNLSRRELAERKVIQMEAILERVRRDTPAGAGPFEERLEELKCQRDAMPNARRYTTPM